MHSINISENSILRIQFDKDPLALKPSNYLTRILNVSIAYNFDAWPRNRTNIFKFKNCLFGATSTVKNSDKKCICIVACDKI